MAGQPSDQAQPYLTGSTLVLFTIAVAIANLMEVLDITIANVSLPTISGELGVAPNQGTWIVTSYAVSNAILVPLTGWFATRFGQVRVFTTAVGLFTLASLLCGIASSFQELLTFRVIQGAVAGLMIPLSQALLMNNYPPEKRGTALMIWGMTVMVAPIIGPILGGWITENFHWSWIFLINVPIGIFCTTVTWMMLRKRETPVKKQPVDVIGAGLLVLWVGTLQILLDKGNELDWFDSPFILSLAILSVVGFVAFLIWELTDDHPIVDLSLLWQFRNFRMGALSLSLGYSVFFSSVIVLPMWLQTQIGYTSQWAGFALAPTGIVALMISPFIVRFMNRVDLRLLASFAFFVFALTGFWRSHFTSGSDFFTIMLPQALQGLAVATFFSPLIAINMSGIPPDRIANASGLQNFLRMMAGSFGTSIVISLWDDRAAWHRTQLTDQLNSASQPMQSYVGQIESLGVPHDLALAQIDRQLTIESFTLATNDIFWLGGCILLALVAVIWRTRPPFTGGGGGN
ncbi:MAG: DHA2 family efflux MFS transporter permease subunit [Gallionellaceae bacterium]|jgi:DHA2 family multidrug resistance protein|nr:DHA2 family efflux MFS transporter permease subunit [Gallionellaceae bacterium]